MPLVLRIDIASGWIALWQITESEQELERLVRAEDVASCERLGNPRRRIERLAWRAIVRELLPRAGGINYDRVGAPVLTDPQGGRIGVSHCRKYAAVIYSSKPCAIDIEEDGRDFSQAADRYISSQERALPVAGNPAFGAAVWCAKETLYKLSATKELDLLEDIRILSAEFSGDGTGRLSGAVGNRLPVTLKMVRHDNIFVVFTV